MAKKGKKLWRKTIDTQELEDALEKSSRAKRQGLEVEGIPDNKLFFIDAEHDAEMAKAVTQGKSLRNKKKEPKLLRCQAILAAAQKAQPVNARLSKVKSKSRKTASSQSRQTLPKAEHARGVEDQSMTDLWGRTPLEPAARPASGAKLIQGVEVDIPGCSFNPDSEQHQDAMAEAVAAEMAKVYAHEHLPAPNRVFNHMPDPDELDALLVDAAEDDDEEDTPEAATEPAESQQVSTVVVDHAAEKKTQAHRNREKRRREAEEEIVSKQKLKKQRRDLDKIVEYEQDIIQQEALQKARLVRKAITKAEKALSEPPKLGRHKFQPASIQVLLSEEIDGSLRRLKGMPLLAKDRFKALQKQGLIEPRLRIEPMMRRKRVAYQTGDRSERAIASHEETMKVIKSRDRAIAKKMRK